MVSGRVATTPTGFGDLVTARAELALGPSASAAVAAMLGLEPVPPRVAETTERRPTAPSPPRPRPSAPAAPRARSDPTTAPEPAVRRLRPVRREPWTDGDGAVHDPLPPVNVSARMPRLPHRQLLPRRVARDVLDAVASTGQPTTVVDVRRVLALVAARRPVPRLPRVHRPSLAAGLQVLVDYGEAMQPFRPDQREVVAGLRRLVGSGLDVRRVLDDPWAGTRPDDDPTWSPRYRPPPAGRPVVVLGTLGRGARARPDLAQAWRRLAVVLAAQGSAVAALVPARRPDGLRGVDVVPWDPVAWRRAVARVWERRRDGAL